MSDVILRDKGGMRPPVVACMGPDWKPYSGVCGACGRTLGPRLGWFCRAPAWCRDVYMSNHDWGYARGVALRRSSPTGRKQDARCSRGDCHESNELEVNHLNPRNGAGYRLGCHHHQDGLEVLCHHHHVDETCSQRGWTRKGVVTVETNQGVLL